MSKKIVITAQICFVSIIAAVLLVGLLRAVFFPKSINEYENRKANRFPEVSVSAFLNAQFQDGVENSLSDQVHGAEFLKQKYHSFESSIATTAIEKFYESDSDKYISYNGVFMFGSDRLVYEPYKLADKANALEIRAENINALSLAHPEIDFYAFYIEKDTDINFETNEKAGLFEFLSERIDTKYCTVGRYQIDDFEQFSKFFYKTDHHWNHIGSYEGYLQIIDLLEISETPISHDAEFLVGEGFSGSKAHTAKSVGVWQENMYAYRFEFPDMSILRNGEKVSDYGAQNKSYAGTLEYGNYYGRDDAELIFDCDAPLRENILIIGESYDNAVLKLVSSHFNKTHSIDLRYYEHYMGKKFDFSEYVELNQIDKVLLIGNADFYTMPEFEVR